MKSCENFKHYWVIPTLESDTKVKTCRVCKEVKDFPPVPVDNFAWPSKSKSHGQVYGYKGGRPKGSKKS